MDPRATGQSKDIPETSKTSTSRKRQPKTRQSSSQRFWISPDTIFSRKGGRAGSLDGRPPPLSVLLVDNDPDIDGTLRIFLEAEGHSVIAVEKTEDAPAKAGRRYFDLAFIDLRPGTESGMDLVTSLHAACPWIKLVVCAPNGSLDSAVEAMKRGAFDYLAKPFTYNQVAHVINRASEVRTLEQKLSTLQAIYDEAVPETIMESSNAGMQLVLSTARQMADSEAPILIRGESGTGKNVLARAIHYWSNRSSRLFVTVPCPSLSAQLLESELFGHARGSFTGALPDYPGRISVCQGGTLFLDEIGNLPLSIQAKLLQVFHGKAYEGTDDMVARKADVRIIAATKADLESDVKAGRFREDLFYRLNALEIAIPPLRERREDILPMAERFSAFFARQSHKPAPGFTREAGDFLTEHDWPGNVRELRNTVERAILLCSEPEIGVQNLLAQPGRTGRLPGLGDPVPLERIEELHIRAVLASTKSIEEASRILKVDSVTLWRRRKKYGI